MYFTRLGYFVILSIILLAAGAVVLIIWPFEDSDGAGGGGNEVVATATVSTPVATATPEPLPSLTFEQVVNFTKGGAVVQITVRSDAILVELNPLLDVSGLGTDSHVFTTTLPPGANSVEEALAAEDIQVNGEGGVPVVRE